MFQFSVFPRTHDFFRRPVFPDTIPFLNFRVPTIFRRSLSMWTMEARSLPLKAIGLSCCCSAALGFAVGFQTAERIYADEKQRSFLRTTVRAGLASFAVFGILVAVAVRR